MQSEEQGVLYVVATPIGNLADISARALRVLAQVDVIAAEDTRHTRRLLQHYDIHAKLISLHNYNESQQTASLLDSLQAQQSIALVSDAGTPLISDPGYRLVKQVSQQGFKVIPIAGPCALIAALSVAGLPTDKFIFEGFLPSKSQAREQYLQTLTKEKRTLIFYEAPHRIMDCIMAMEQAFGAERPAVIARELSKTFETIARDSLAGLRQWLQSDTHQQKGEFVVLVHGAEQQQQLSDEAMRVTLLLAAELSAKQAASLAAKITGIRKNTLYQYIVNSL